MSRDGRSSSSPAPHPDHFDPTKYGPDGEPIGKRRGPGRPRGSKGGGRPSKLKADDVEQLLFLWRIVKVATDDLCEFLGERGVSDQQTRTRILRELERGWRPQK